MGEIEQMAALGVDRLTIAVRSKELDAVADELGRFGDEMISQTKDL
jgi:hypothetical protein